MNKFASILPILCAIAFAEGGKINIVVFAEAKSGKRYDDYILSDMEKQCKFLEKEQAAKKYEVDVVADSSSAVAMALEIAYSKFGARPSVKTGARAWLIGENKEYWHVVFYYLMKDYNKEVHFKALISRNSGAFLCGRLTRATNVEY